MQSNVQSGNLLADILSGSPSAIDATYWHAANAEFAAIGSSITAAEIDTRRARLSASLINPKTGEVVATGDTLKHNHNTPKGSVAHLHLEGVMLSQDFLWYRGVNHLAAELIAAENNPNVSAVLLEVNSGGGSAMAGQMLLSAIKSMSTPVYVLTHFMASAAIMATLPVKMVVASSPGVEVGSIGSMWQINTTAVDNHNATYKTIYAKKATLKNRIFRALLMGDYSPLEKNLNKVNDQFIAEVKYHRVVTSDTLTGEMFFADDAKRKGLIDGVMSFNQLVKTIQTDLEAEATGSTKKTVVNPATAKVKPLPPKKVNTSRLTAVKPSLPPVAKVAAKEKPWLMSPINQRAAKMLEQKNKRDKAKEVPNTKQTNGKRWLQNPMNQ